MMQRLKSWTLLTVLLFLLFSADVQAQLLKAGFDADEYLNALTVTFRQGDSASRNNRGGPVKGFSRVYRSAVVGLDNRWDLWISETNKLGIVSIRGTVGTGPSWMANFYSAMTPATGALQINDSTTFQYQLAANPAAAVQTGWLISLAHLAPDIEAQIKTAYEKGIKDFILVGHSQGGAITFLLRSYLQYRMHSNALPKDITLKTYCSAAPKPGNTAYVYDFDFITRNGWAFTIVNTADWVPESPISIQQLTDMNQLNPFSNIGSALGTQNFFVRLYAKNMFNKLRKSTRKAQGRYEKYLGNRVYKLVRKTLPQLKEPQYSSSMNYMRAGTPIVLQPDAVYNERFAASEKNKQNVWYHHTYEAYSSLIKNIYSKE